MIRTLPASERIRQVDAHETTPSDAAIGQAEREWDTMGDGWKKSHPRHLYVHNRAREIEQGRGALPELPEPAAYCAPSNPFNTSAFAWPGSDRRAAHTDALYTEADVRAYGEACRRMGNRDE